MLAIKKTYFLAEVSIFDVVSILLVVSGAGIGAVAAVSGVTVLVLSLEVDVSLLLLHATNAVAIIAIARNFFI